MPLGQMYVEGACREIVREVGGQYDFIAVPYEDR